MSFSNCLIPVLLCVALGSPQGSTHDPKLISDYRAFLDNAQKRQEPISVDGTYQKRNQIGSPSEETTKGHFQFSRSSKNVLVKTTIDNYSKKGQEDSQLPLDSAKRQVQGTVHCINDDYGFRLVYEKGKEPTIDYLSKDTKQLIPPIKTFVRRCVDIPLSIDSIDLLTFIDRNAGKISSVTEVPNDGRSRKIKINFTFNLSDVPTKNGRAIAQLDSGYWVVSPDDGWLLHEYYLHYRLSTGSTYSKRGSVGYKNNPDSTLVPEKVVFQTFQQSEGKSQNGEKDNMETLTDEDIYTFSLYKREGEPLNHFRVSYFGFPELGPEQGSGSGWWLAGGMVVTGALFLVAAILFRQTRKAA